MVASTPEYHILGKRVAVNRLRLGSIIKGIQDPTRLNAGKEPAIEAERLNYWHDTGFKASREQAMKGEAGVALKIAALEGIGGDGKVNGKRGDTNKYSFSVIDTLDFDSDTNDYKQAGQAEGVQTFLRNSKHKPVFFITGIKVGRVPTEEGSDPTFDATRVKSLGGTLSLGIHIPSVLSVGPNTEASREITVTQQYREHNDRIFAIRVVKLLYKKTGLLRPRDWVDEPFDDGAEMVGENGDEDDLDEEELAFDQVEEIDMDIGELDGFDMVTETDGPGQEITWVVPKGW